MAESGTVTVQGQIRGLSFVYDESDLLGSGGYSNVYAATDEGARRLAAKVIRLGGRAVDLDQAWREVEVLDELTPRPNDHLVHALDVALVGDCLIFAMMRADASLADLISKGPVPEAEAKVILIQIAKGMESLALASVIHRDVKPTNILNLNGQWCLADFGIARITSKATAPHTFQGSGTLEYRAPEIWRGQRETVEADYYALGCIAFELITGQKAFPYADDIRERHLSLVLDLPEGCDPTLRSVVAQLLAKDPMARPRDARQIREQLEVSGTFSPQQQLFQGVRAKLDERVLRITASHAAAAERDEHFRMAGVQVNTLWKRFSEKVKQVFSDAEDDSGPGFLSLRFRGISVSIEDACGGGYFDLGDRPEFVLAAEVRVRPASGHLVYLANIYSVWVDDRPATNLIRFETLDTRDPMRTPEVRELVPRGIKPATMPRAYSEYGSTFGQKVVDDVPVDPDMLLGYLAEYLEPLI